MYIGNVSTYKPDKIIQVILQAEVIDITMNQGVQIFNAVFSQTVLNRYYSALRFPPFRTLTASKRRVINSVIHVQKKHYSKFLQNIHVFCLQLLYSIIDTIVTLYSTCNETHFQRCQFLGILQASGMQRCLQRSSKKQFYRTCYFAALVEKNISTRCRHPQPFKVVLSSMLCSTLLSLFP